MKLKELEKTLRKSVGNTTAADSPIARINDWYDTGSYAINRVLTGDIHKGIAKGCTTCIYGESQSGKSLLAAQTAAIALKEGKIDKIYLVDSEGGAINIFETLGVPLDKIEYIPVASIEECSVALLKLYSSFVQMHKEYEADPENNDDIRAIVILDSFGGLVSEKLITDAVDKDKQVQDQGLGMKLKNNMVKGLMMRVGLSQVSLIIINHTYDAVGQMFPSKIKPLPGGKGLEFACHAIMQMSKLFVKAGSTDFLTGREDESTTDGMFYKGNRISAFAWKNRGVIPAFEAKMYIDFATGISKYDGLIEDAVKYGYIEEVRGGYIVPSYSDKRVTYKELVNSDEIWNTFIEKFNAESIEKMKYSAPILDQIKAAEERIEEITGVE